MSNEMHSHHGINGESEKKFPNKTIELLLTRSSCRSFEDKPIPDDVLEYVLDAGVHAPTGGNLQPYSIIKIKDNKVNTKLAEMCFQDFIGQAPVNLLFCIDWHRLKRWAEIEIAPFSANQSFRHFWISFQDVIITAQNICTAADAMELGSVYIGTVAEYFEELSKMFELPEGVIPVVLLCLGYPKHRPPVKRKLGIETVVHNEKYNIQSDEIIKDAYNKKYQQMKVDINDERMTQMKIVCNKVHDREFAEKCKNKILENGYISPVQRYFGLHYRADELPENNEQFIKAIEQLGFNWFKKVEF
ncbi:MAG: nitroreductase family protein [candidate division Zixibacteria bacterium]|nr:nitroreductase family protein [candidate division Zixibacteria bacterium]